MKLGIDNIETVSDKLGGRLALMTHPCGVDSLLRHDTDILREKFDLRLLIGCEHGVVGAAQAGESGAAAFDPDTGLPVESIYEGGQVSWDAFDTLVYHMQDVGARYYTYLYALSDAMEACAGHKKSVVILDRPNPVGGTRVEGTVLDERFASPVGRFAMPIRYGLTIGESALWLRAYRGLDVDVHVCLMTGWTRDMLWADTGLSWISPSPNMPSADAALCYLATCVFEGTNVSEGRGTTTPFQWVGAPWIDARTLEEHMNGLGLSGVRFRRAHFQPTFSKFAGELCHGVQLHVTDPRSCDICLVGLSLAQAIRDLYPHRFEWLPNRFAARLLGDDGFLVPGVQARDYMGAHAQAVARFAQARRPFLLYP